MMRTRTVRSLLREQAREHAQTLAKRDEMIQSLLDRIQHPDRTPVWREAPPEPLDDTAAHDPWALVLDPDQLPA